MAQPRSRRSFLKGGALGALTGATLAGGLDGLAHAVERTPQSSRPSDLKITGVRGGLIRGEHSLFVKIETNQGITGHGQAVDGVYGTYYVMKHLAQRHLIGRSPLNVHRLQEEMRRGGLFKGAQAGMYVCVMSALETALWDLVGKAFGLPVYQLLGGTFRDRIRVYCDTAGSRLEPAEMGRRAKEDVDTYGFTAVKFDIDDARDPNKLDPYNWSVSLPELERMVAQIAAVRAAVGPHIDICVDCHGRFDEQAAHKIAKAMEPFNLMWLEEPVPAEFPEAYARIRQETTTPICGGENWYLTYGFRRPLEIGSLRRDHARPPEGGRARGGPAHRQPRQHLQRPLRPPHGRLLPRGHVLRPRLRLGPQLPHPRVADLLPHHADVPGDRDP